jgi:hypothetical protein
MRDRQETTATLAHATGLDRTLLRRRLAGEDDLTVDDFIKVARALELSPAGMGLDETGSADGPPEVPTTRPRARGLALATVGGDDAPDPDWEPDPTGNLPMQVIRLGFLLGIDLFLEFDVSQLGESGVPPAVLGRFQSNLPIRLESKWHKHNRPQYLDDGFRCTLSFDALYTCTFPWRSILRVSFQLPAEAPEPAPSPAAKPSGGHLRVVK